MQSLGHRVTFVTLGHPSADAESASLRRMGVEVATSRDAVSLPDVLSSRGTQFHVVYLNGLRIGVRSIDAIRRLAPAAKVMLRLSDLGDLVPVPCAPYGALCAASVSSRQDEALRAITLADVVLSPSVTGLAMALGDAVSRLDHVAQAPYVVDVEPLPASRCTHRNLVGLWGDQDRPADRDAIESFIREVMPQLRGRLPGLRLHVYGHGWHDDRLGALATPDVAFEEPGSYVAGGCRIAVLPEGSGPHLPSHAVEGLVHGIPLLLSADRAAREYPMDGVVVCTGAPRSWAEAIIRLCEDQEAWARLSEEARRSGRQAFSFERGQVLMRAALAVAGAHAVPSAEALVTRSARPDWPRSPGVLTSDGCVRCRQSSSLSSSGDRGADSGDSPGVEQA